MKKLSLLFMASALLYSCTTTEKKEQVYNDLFIDNLKGDVLVVETSPYKADSAGNAAAMDSCCVSIAEYDSKGYIAKETKKDAAGKVSSEDVFTHFENGRMKEMVSMKDGKVVNKLSITIDSAGNYISGERFDSAGKMTNFYTGLTQDMYGNVLTGTEHKADSSIGSTWKNNFDKHLMVGGESTDSSGKVVYSSTIKRNEKGDQIERNTTEVTKDSTTKKTFTYRYDTYDETGNWTQRTEMENGKATKVEKRTITYAKKE